MSETHELNLAERLLRAIEEASIQIEAGELDVAQRCLALAASLLSPDGDYDQASDGLREAVDRIIGRQSA